MRQPTYLIIVVLVSMLFAPPFSAFAQLDSSNYQFSKVENKEAAPKGLDTASIACLRNNQRRW